MTVSAANSTAPDLTEQDRLLIEMAEESIRDGRQLLRWCRAKQTVRSCLPVVYKKPFRLSNRAETYLGAAEIDGKPVSVMGCRQEVEFGPVEAPNAVELLTDFVLGEFLSKAHWKYPDGWMGGFTIEQSLYKTMDGRYGRLPDELRSGCIDLREIGRRYEWVLLTIYINDFVMEFGRFRKHLKEALCAVLNPDFIQILEDPSSEFQCEISIGYPVVRFAPIPNFFGFGPGKFQIAVKLFTFVLTRQNQVRVRLEFASAPRCEKVFDFGKRWPDPVYGGARLLQRLSLGRFKPQPVHDFVDRKMLDFHCAVHQQLMDGVDTIWREWMASPRNDESQSERTSAQVAST